MSAQGNICQRCLRDTPPPNAILQDGIYYCLPCATQPQPSQRRQDQAILYPYGLTEYPAKLGHIRACKPVQSNMRDLTPSSFSTVSTPTRSSAQEISQQQQQSEYGAVSPLTSPYLEVQNSSAISPLSESGKNHRFTFSKAAIITSDPQWGWQNPDGTYPFYRTPPLPPSSFDPASAYRAEIEFPSALFDEEYSPFPLRTTQHKLTLGTGENLGDFTEDETIRKPRKERSETIDSYTAQGEVIDEYARDVWRRTRVEGRESKRKENGCQGGWDWDSPYDLWGRT